MTWLLDTDVISALAPSRADRPRDLIDWIERESDDLNLCVIPSTTQRYTIAVSVTQFLDGTRTLAGKNDDVIVLIAFRGILDLMSGGSANIMRGRA